MSKNLAPFQSDPTSADAADAATFVQTNLVSDISGLAMATDPNLVNPWGVSFNATTGSPFWISDQATGLWTLYVSAGNITRWSSPSRRLVFHRAQPVGYSTERPISTCLTACRCFSAPVREPGTITLLLGPQAQLGREKPWHRIRA